MASFITSNLGANPLCASTDGIAHSLVQAAALDRQADEWPSQDRVTIAEALAHRAAAIREPLA
jgi:hypothetical protein